MLHRDSTPTRPSCRGRSACWSSPGRWARGPTAPSRRPHGAGFDLVLANIGGNLRAAGMDYADVFKISYFLVGDIDLPRLREKMRACFGGTPPCSTMVFVSRLAAPVYKVGIEAWASRGE